MAVFKVSIQIDLPFVNLSMKVPFVWYFLENVCSNILKFKFEVSGGVIDLLNIVHKTVNKINAEIYSALCLFVIAFKLFI